jgi:hypothetical protein
LLFLPVNAISLCPNPLGNILYRCITDAGYRGHNAPPDHKFKVYTSGQKRGASSPGFSPCATPFSRARGARAAAHAAAAEWRRALTGGGGGARLMC